MPNMLQPIVDSMSAENTSSISHRLKTERLCRPPQRAKRANATAQDHRQRHKIGRGEIFQLCGQIWEYSDRRLATASARGTFLPNVLGRREVGKICTAPPSLHSHHI